MHYIIYKITNQINGKYYIGRHATKDVNDSYMGSGIGIKNAIAKKKIGITILCIGRKAWANILAGENTLDSLSNNYKPIQNKKISTLIPNIC